MRNCVQNHLQDERRLFRKGDSRHRRPTGAPASFLKWAFVAILRQESLQTRLGKQRYSSERAFLFLFFFWNASRLCYDINLLMRLYVQLDLSQYLKPSAQKNKWPSEEWWPVTFALCAQTEHQLVFTETGQAEQIKTKHLLSVGHIQANLNVVFPPWLVALALTQAQQLS